MLSERTTEDMDNRELPILLAIVEEDRFVGEILKIIFNMNNIILLYILVYYFKHFY